VSRYRHRAHYNDLRRIGLADLPKDRLGPADRWHCTLTWTDGSSIGVKKIEDAVLNFSFRAGDGDLNYYVPLKFQPRHFGGAQAYLTCVNCYRPCRVIRFVRAELRCQRCIGAIYRTQSMSAKDRALHRFRKLRARVRPGTEDYNLDWFPRRPKGMRRATFMQIRAKAWESLVHYDELDDARLWRVLARFGPEVLEELKQGPG
jgi:hypothetical protein